MQSSTSRHDSFDRRLLAVAFAGIVGAPVVWLTALQTGYTLAYQACDTRSTSWVIVPTVTLFAVTIGITIVTWRAHARARHARLPLPLLGWLATGMAALMTVVMFATSIPPMILHPCD